MLYIISILLWISNIVKKNSKFLFLLLFVWLFILMAFSYGNADYSTYQLYFRIYGNNFNWSVLTLNNGLFKLLCALFTKLGLNYEHLLIFMTSVGLFNLYLASKRFDTLKNIVFSLYFIYPFMIDITQIRNFVAMSFMIYGCTYLLIEKSHKKAIICFFIFNLIASLFHFTFVFYFIIVLIRFINKENWKYFIIPIIAFAILSMNFSISEIAKLTSIERTEAYFGQHISLITLFAIVIYYSLIIFSLSKIATQYKEEKWISAIYKLNILMTITIPLIYYSFEFMRIYRNIFFLNYVVIAFCIMKNKEYNKYRRNKLVIGKHNLYPIILIILSFISFYVFIFHDYADNVVLPVFQMNKLFFQN